MLPLSLPYKLYSSFSQVLCSQDCLMRCSSHRLHTLSLILSHSLSLFICLPVLFRLKVCCLWLSMAIHRCICKPHSLPLSSNTCSSLSSTLCQIYLSFSPDLSIRSNVKQQDRAQRLNTLCFAFFFLRKLGSIAGLSFLPEVVFFLNAKRKKKVRECNPCFCSSFHFILRLFCQQLKSAFIHVAVVVCCSPTTEVLPLASSVLLLNSLPT